MDRSAHVTSATRTAERPSATAPDGASPARSEVQFSPNLVTLSAPLSSGAEAIRVLRTHVLAQHMNAGRRALAICGASLGVGCTFVSANLAVALAQSGLKVLLVDADLRAPRIQEFIRPAGTPGGLGACLRAPGSAISEYIEEDVYPNLSVMFAGEGLVDTHELLAREWFDEVMKYCLREYDATIVDTPPANTSSDCRRISSVVGYSLLVARRNRSLVADVKTLAEQLIDDHGKVVGTLLNAD